MKNLTLENLTKVCGGVYSGPSDKLEQEVSSITTDSRKAEAGTLFVPIVGERVDAHKFIPQVMEAGALATLSERILENADFPYIKVESSLQAVKDIAEFYLQQLHQGCFCRISMHSYPCPAINLPDITGQGKLLPQCDSNFICPKLHHRIKSKCRMSFLCKESYQSLRICSNSLVTDHICKVINSIKFFCSSI